MSNRVLSKNLTEALKYRRVKLDKYTNFDNSNILETASN